MDATEIVNGLPVPLDHPRFKKDANGWSFRIWHWMEHSTWLLLDQTFECASSGNWYLAIDDCRCVARSAWLDRALACDIENHRDVPEIVANYNLYLKHAEACRLWRI